MKRRTLLRGALLGAPAVAVAAKLELKDPDVVIPHIVGENQLGEHVVSNDFNDFTITIDRISKVIDVKPRFDSKPHLSVLAFHRYLCDLCDRMYMGEDQLDITSDQPTDRYTDDIIGMNHGWVTTQRTKEVLVGGIEENGVKYATIKLIGEVDYNLTKNLRFTTGDGVVHPCGKTGYERIRVPDNGNNLLRVEHDSYRNIQFLYTEESGGLEPHYGGWESNVWDTQAFLGTIIVPIFSMG